MCEMWIALIHKNVNGEAFRHTKNTNISSCCNIKSLPPQCCWPRPKTLQISFVCCRWWSFWNESRNAAVCSLYYGHSVAGLEPGTIVVDRRRRAIERQLRSTTRPRLLWSVTISLDLGRRPLRSAMRPPRSTKEHQARPLHGFKKDYAFWRSFDNCRSRGGIKRFRRRHSSEWSTSFLAFYGLGIVSHVLMAESTWHRRLTRRKSWQGDSVAGEYRPRMFGRSQGADSHPDCETPHIVDNLTCPYDWKTKRFRDT